MRERKSLNKKGTGAGRKQNTWPLSGAFWLIKFAFVSLWRRARIIRLYPCSSIPRQAVSMAKRNLRVASPARSVSWGEKGNPLIPQERCPSHGPLCQLAARQLSTYTRGHTFGLSWILWLNVSRAAYCRRLDIYTYVIENNRF